MTGPTGSGKSTTLSSLLGEFNSPEINILTVEDPVEYQINGINQVHVNSRSRPDVRHRPALLPAPGPGHHHGRRDPRPRDGAESPSKPPSRATWCSRLFTPTTRRQFDHALSIWGSSLSWSPRPLIGIVAQRLVRGICKNCRESYEITPDDAIHRLIRANVADIPEDSPLTLYRGRGCQQCNNRGYKGRTAIHEVLVPDMEIQALTNQQVSSEIIREAAIKAGMRTLLMDGLLKAVKGMTTVDEVVRTAYTG